MLVRRINVHFCQQTAATLQAMRIDFLFKTLSTRGALGEIGGNVMIHNGWEYDCIILRGQD